MQAKSLVLEAGKLYMKEIVLPILRNEWVRLKIDATGICGTDVQKIYSKDDLPPTILGHEFVGTVVESRAPSIKKGATVIGMPLLPCYECEFCKTGNVNLCKSGRAIGRNVMGSFSEYVDLPNENCFPLPPNVKLETGVLADVIAVALHAIRMTSGVDNKNCLVIGDGPIGISLGCILKLFDATVTIIGKRQVKNTLGDVIDKFEMTNQTTIEKNKYDIVFETVGRQQFQTLNTAVNTVKAKGEIVVLGVYSQGYLLPVVARELFIKEIKLVGSNAYILEDFQEAIHLLSRYNHIFSQLITHKFSELLKAIEQMKNKQNFTCKVVAVFND